ncbi:hypothetical protein RhiTH_005751 [Rhizoctonia solani]
MAGKVVRRNKVLLLKEATEASLQNQFNDWLVVYSMVLLQAIQRKVNTDTTSQVAEVTVDLNLVPQQAAVQNATQHSGGTGDTSLFSTALGFLNQNQAQHTEPINEQHVQNAHAEAYEKGKASSLDAGSLGAAAAMQVLKNFTSGSGPTGSGGGDSRSQLIGMAMSEASKLFESQESKTGQKQDAVNSAAMTVMKLLVQSKTGPGATNAGGNDFGSLLNLASKFLK